MGLLGRIVISRPRLFAALGAGLLAYAVLPPAAHRSTRALLAWDVATGLYALLAALLFFAAPKRTMEADALRQQEGEWTVFAITLLAAGFSMVAVLGEFSNIKDLSPATRGAHVAVVFTTLLFSWLMTHITFAFRYAHEYYEAKPGGGIVGGLQFPSDSSSPMLPGYADFLYFALVLGMTFQVSDVQITTREFRRLATMHGLLAFLFNATIIALSVNLAAGLL